MSSSVTLSIVTNSLIAASKAFGWSVTGSPTLFAETIHSLADVGNQDLLEDGVALLGIFLTLLVAGISYLWGPRPIFDAAVAIGVGVLLGVMALFLAGINRRLLIDSSDQELDRATEAWLHEREVAASVRSLVLDDDRAIVFVRSTGPVDDSFTLGQELKAHADKAIGKRVDAVYWKFRSGAEPADRRRGGEVRAVASE